MVYDSTKHMFARFLACALLLICALGCLLGASSAYAVSHADTTPDKKLAAAQEKVEQSAKDLDEAYARVKKLDKQIKTAKKRLKEVKAEIPIQEERAREAWRILYKTSEDAPSMIDLFLSAESVNQFIEVYQYMEAIQTANIATINKLGKLKVELTETNETLQKDMKEAKEEQDRAYVALEKAKAERQKVQADAIAAAEAAARAQAAKEKKEAEKKAEKDKPKKDEEIKPIDKGDVNWDMSKQEFVSIWTKRINKYLEGSNMAGTGKYFAKAAWKYGVDPRWSPAISCIESGKGKKCFKPFNAWGWGNKAWSSWSEAIDAHVSGLARGYGYTVSIAAAQKYCPPNWRYWYTNVRAQMKKI